MEQQNSISSAAKTMHWLDAEQSSYINHSGVYARTAQGDFAYDSEATSSLKASGRFAGIVKDLARPRDVAAPDRSADIAADKKWLAEQVKLYRDGVENKYREQASAAVSQIKAGIKSHALGARVEAKQFIEPKIESYRQASARHSQVLDGWKHPIDPMMSVVLTNQYGSQWHLSAGRMRFEHEKMIADAYFAQGLPHPKSAQLAGVAADSARLKQAQDTMARALSKESVKTAIERSASKERQTQAQKVQQSNSGGAAKKAVMNAPAQAKASAWSGIVGRGRTAIAQGKSAIGDRVRSLFGGAPKVEQATGRTASAGAREELAGRKAAPAAQAGARSAAQSKTAAPSSNAARAGASEAQKDASPAPSRTANDGARRGAQAAVTKADAKAPAKAPASSRAASSGARETNVARKPAPVAAPAQSAPAASKGRGR